MLFDVLHHSFARPKGEVHLELLGPLVSDCILDVLLLLVGKPLRCSFLAAASLRTKCFRTSCRVQVDGLSNCTIAYAGLLLDRHRAKSLLVQAHDHYAHCIEVLGILPSIHLQIVFHAAQYAKKSPQKSLYFVVASIGRLFGSISSARCRLLIMISKISVPNLAISIRNNPTKSASTHRLINCQHTRNV